MRRARNLVVLAFCLVLSGFATLANWGGGADGCLGSGDFQALGTKQVRMAQEKLSIDLYRDRARVRVEYVLVNTGEALTVTAGFPCAVYDQPEGQLLEIEDYQIAVDGRKIAYARKSGEAVKGSWLPGEFAARLQAGEYFEPKLFWLVSQVPFTRGATRKVVIEYISLYDSSAGGVSNDIVYDADTFRYLLSTGSVWQGPITKGEITIRAVTIEPRQITILPTGRFRREGGVWHWTFTNIEPSTKDDLTICLNNEVAVYGIYDGESPYRWYSAYGDQFYLDSSGYTVQASSELEGPYEASNVCDQNAATAWVEGVAGDGIGQSLTIGLDRPAKGILLGIIPGYAKSEGIYYANNRVAEFKIVLNGTRALTCSLQDDFTRHGADSPKAYQFIDLGNDLEIRTIKLIITKVHKGTKYSDTAVSEILLRQKLAKKPTIYGAR